MIIWRFLFAIHYGVEGTTLRVVRVFVLSEIGVMDSDLRQECPWQRGMREVDLRFIKSLSPSLRHPSVLGYVPYSRRHFSAHVFYLVVRAKRGKEDMTHNRASRVKARK